MNIRTRIYDFRSAAASDNLVKNKRFFADIVIGDHVLIGNNVYAKEGAVISNYAMIGANSVVTSHVPKKCNLCRCASEVNKVQRRFRRFKL